MIWILLLLLIIGITYSIASISGAPWVPMRTNDIGRIITIIKKYNFPTKQFIELGSGDGRLLQAVAQQGWQATGYEISLLPLCLAYLRRLFSPKKFTCIVKNFWQAPLQTANIVFVFLLPSTLLRFSKKAQQELASGSVVISYVWPLPNWQPIIVDKLAGQVTIYVYEQP